MEINGTFYSDDTPRELAEKLEEGRLNGWRVRLFLGDRNTGKDWGEELKEN